jgi:uncharacterized protein (DUF1684 family)
VATCEPMDELELLDWKRRVLALYAGARADEDRPRAAAAWRAGRDGLFRGHPQTPLRPEARPSFTGVPYFPYDPAARVSADVAPAEPERRDMPASAGGQMAMVRIALARFRLAETECELELYSLEGYGGGLFLPFADATNGSETYGAGRYLLDTIKGADLGGEGDRLVLDFNFAYNPSCSYDPRWACPLAPVANRLPMPVRAGERLA